MLQVGARADGHAQRVLRSSGTSARGSPALARFWVLERLSGFVRVEFFHGGKLLGFEYAVIFHCGKTRTIKKRGVCYVYPPLWSLVIGQAYCRYYTYVLQYRNSAKGVSYGKKAHYDNHGRGFD